MKDGDKLLIKIKLQELQDAVDKCLMRRWLLEWTLNGDN